MRHLYPIGIQNFQKIREDGYVYVDKTAAIHDLFHTGNYYFLSRPRRFGKSLLISTIQAYAEGKKELFKGLAMENLESDWLSYPIFHLDLNAQNYDSEDSLDSMLNDALSRWENVYGVRPSETTSSLRFQGLIQRAAEQSGQRVVILVDEYDKPLLQSIGNETLQDRFRNTLKAFYGALKSCDRYIRFAFLTGVTKFGKISVFSDLNNLRDLSMLSKYADICGITERELQSYFSEDIHLLADTLDLSYEETCLKLKENYDGYHFSANGEGIYNPFSLLNTFVNLNLGSYWFETGTPTYLVHLLQKHYFSLERLENIVTDSASLNMIDQNSLSPIPIIYQSGYLTITGYNKEFDTYMLGYPNREVKQGFIRFLLPYYTHVSQTDSAFEIQLFTEDIRAGRVDEFMKRLQTFFADTPYQIVSNREVHYQNVLYLIFRLLGFYVDVEYSTNRGRIDLVLKSDSKIYVMEFKLNGSADEALAQINENGYVEPFLTDGRKIIKVGVNFSDSIRNIKEWVVA